ncbi:MAG TPA: 23S rRNA (pseudouridine(1915)-N(3))-methyltransferase RlmH, partial [Usitatibacter sp.]|nr:23S rRNA (pseudouridine(1915)-N(3))-methyltransferase RlmH [Usitatibacter sp.]
MRILILSVGHKMPAWIQEGFQEYAKRMPSEARVELVEVKPGRDKAEEGRRLLEALPDRATLFALDERAK